MTACVWSWNITICLFSTGKIKSSSLELFNLSWTVTALFKGIKRFASSQSPVRNDDCKLLSCWLSVLAKIVMFLQWWEKSVLTLCWIVVTLYNILRQWSKTFNYVSLDIRYIVADRVSVTIMRQYEPVLGTSWQKIGSFRGLFSPKTMGMLQRTRSTSLRFEFYFTVP